MIRLQKAILELPRIFRGSFFVRPATLVALTILGTTILAFKPGLAGPFLFDDPSNIVGPMTAWLEGQSNWHEFVFGNRSGMLGRTLSMLTFALNGATTGLDVVPFKATNLAIHLLCGSVLFLLLRRLLRHDRQLSSATGTVACLITAIWLIHPIQVSTVLYVVQRMAQLSTLFMLLALYAYVVGREALQAGRTRHGWSMLFVALPACTLLAALSKENGVLVPLLCAVVEFTYFPTMHGASPANTRSRAPIWLFFGIFLALPTTLACVALAIHPTRLLDYDGRLFTLWERVLTQPHVLMDYVGALLLPRGASLGVYTDDFPISHGLLDPPATLWAIVGLATWIAASVLLRRRIPAFFAGTGLFLCGHAMESTILPLEMYFEHRNYFPSIGIFLAVAGLLANALALAADQLRSKRTLILLRGGAMAIVLCLATATAIRSETWSTWAGIAEQGVQQHPTSRRAHLDKISILLTLGKTDEAREVLRGMLDFPDVTAKHTAATTLVWLDCREHGRVEQDDLERMRTMIGSKLQLAELFTGEKLGNLLIARNCAGLSKEEFGQFLRELTKQSGQSSGLTPIWRLRFMASRLFAESGRLPLAIEQSALAWMTGKADPALGVFLINLYLAHGDRRSADILLPEVRSKIPYWDQRSRSQLNNILARFNVIDIDRTGSQNLPKPGDDIGKDTRN